MKRLKRNAKKLKRAKYKQIQRVKIEWSGIISLSQNPKREKNQTSKSVDSLS